MDNNLRSPRFRLVSGWKNCIPPPFCSHVYRYDFESALVVFEGVIFRISEFTEDLETETALDQIKDLAYFPPDENGFIKGKLIPSEMSPGSMIYYTDDTHYIPQKLQVHFQNHNDRHGCRLADLFRRF